ncbi:MAG: hypothetical protein HZA50_08470 [Planctomycetes bacterium]|nr:hypothetical protein [Planctomycetota bacterium]
MEDNLTPDGAPESGGRKCPRTRLILAAIIAVGLALRIAITIAGIQSWPVTPDSFGYIETAQALADDGRFELGGRPEIFRSPGYPAVLATEIRLSPSGWSETVGYWYLEIFVPALTVQVLLDCVLIGLTFWLGAILASRGVGFLAAGLQAVSPLAIGSCCMILSDSLFALILTVGLIMLVKFLKSGSWLMLICMAITMAAGCYVRPIGMVLSAIIALAIVFVRPRPACTKTELQAGLSGVASAKPERLHHNKTNIGIRLVKAFVFATIIAVCLAPWVVRNIRVADYAGFSSFATDSLFKFSASRIEAGKTGMDWQETNEKMESELYNENKQTQGDLARARAQKAWQVVSDNPGRAVALHLKGDLAFFLPGGSDVLQLLDLTQSNRGTLDVIRTEGLIAGLRNYFGDSSAAILAAVPMVLFFLIQVAGLAWCAIKKLRLSMSAFAWIALLLVAASALLPGPCNHPRFRVPFEPIINIAASVGIFLLLARKGKKTMSDGKTPALQGERK